MITLLRKIRVGPANDYAKRRTSNDTKHLMNPITNCKPRVSLVERETFQEIFLRNERPRQYKKGSQDLYRLESVLESMQTTPQDIPIVIGGKKQTTRMVNLQMMPHKKTQKLAKFYYASDQQLFKAMDTAKEAQKMWDREPISKRLDIWEKAANLLSTKYHGEVVAATMLGTGKVLVEAEQDAGADLIDIMRINAQYLKLITQWQPMTPNEIRGLNHLVLRGLEGFVAAMCPFNSIALAVNLALTPVLMGNCVLWKPHDNTVLTSWIIYKVLKEAGLPENVISFVPCEDTLFAQTITHSELLAGINFAGSGMSFKKLWKLVAKYLEYYHTFPRLVGDCGGKNFHFVHESADINLVINSTIRAAFEYSGQKRSSCSRLYVPFNLWEQQIKPQLIAQTNALKIGDVTDLDSFSSAVIDMNAFSRLMTLLETTQRNPKFRLVTGGKYSGNKGYFVYPTILECTELMDRIFKDDYCGPVLIVFVYKDKDLKRVMDNLSSMSCPTLAGSVFANDEGFLKTAIEQFKNCTGNLFINDKTTSFTIGQQPYGGTRLSGTNDKVGTPHYLLRWSTMQCIRENFPQMEMTEIEQNERC